MVGQLVLVGAIALVAVWSGWSAGRSSGYRDALRWRDRVDGMAELLEASQFDEPGSPLLN